MRRPLVVVTSSPEETREVARVLAGLLRRGDVVSLTGDLGAGKTTFVQGAAAGLGVDQPVLSPTFTLVREYEGEVRVHHLDVYRLDRLQDVLDLGLEDLFEPDAVTFIEWGDAIETLLPPSHLQVEIALRPDHDRRRITLTGAGNPWAERWEPLEHVLRAEAGRVGEG